MAMTHAMTLDDIVIVAPYNAHVAAIERAFAAAGLRDPFVGTVDKFQGQERPVSIYAMGTSTPEDAPRGMEFLYSLNRLNVATSRARCVTAVVCSPALLRVACSTPRQMRLANGLCLAVEAAKAHPQPGSLARPSDISWRTHDRAVPQPRRPGSRPPSIAFRAVRGRRAGQHGTHRGGHRRDDRRQGPAGIAAPSPAHPARPSSSGRRWVRSCCPRSWPGGVAGSASSPGYSVGVVGALVATAAVVTRSFPLLLFGTVLIGFGNASNQLSRYTAADMVPPERRASAIGLVVWAATVGSVVGPWLVPIASDMASATSGCRHSPARTSCRWCSSGSRPCSRS